MSDDRDTLRRVRSDTGSMVKVMMRIDQILDRFIGHELFRLRHDRHRARLAVRSFDDD